MPALRPVVVTMGPCTQKCLVACVLATALVGSWLVVAALNAVEPGVHERLRAALRPAQRREYEAVVRERRGLFLTGLAAAAVFVGVTALVEHAQGVQLLDGCSSLLVAALLVVGVYTLYPKRRYLVEVLDTQEQREAWVDVYRRMQVSMWVSAAVLAVGGGLLAAAVGTERAQAFTGGLLVVLVVGLLASLAYKALAKKKTRLPAADGPALS
jgi:hypothetical protein